MDEAGYYQPLTEKLCQGDILKNVPHLLLRGEPDLEVLKPDRVKGGHPIHRITAYSLNSDTQHRGLHGDGGLVSAVCQVGFGMVLTQGCEIDKTEDGPLQIAIIKPLDEIQGDEARDNVRGNYVYRYFYLPENQSMPESYVDFRRVSTIYGDLVDKLERITGLSPIAVEALREQFIDFVTRPEDVDEDLSG